MVSAKEMSMSGKVTRLLKERSLLLLCEAVSWEGDEQSR